MNTNQRTRARFILFCLLFVAGIIGAKLFHTQILNGKELAAKAETQYKKPLAALFDRGSISFYAKDGSRPAAAALTTTYLVFMNPKLVADSRGTYQALTEYMDLDEGEFMRKASLKDDPYEEIAEKVDTKIAQSVKNLSLRGIGVSPSSIRSYPGKRLASHTIGLIGEDDGEVKGRYGLERTYEDVLSNDDSGNVSWFAQVFGDGVGNDGVDNGSGDIVTTLEPTVQAYLETVLKKTSAQWRPDEIGGIIMDPGSGDIISMAAAPDFDPNDTSNITDPAVFSNPLVENAYEMGSIMKPLTVAVGLDTGAVSAASTYDDTGTMTLSGKKISNFDGRARGSVKIQEILSQSLNVGAATVALKVGKDKFVDYFSSFGFGSRTGIDQPNETVGLTGNLKTGRDIEIATMAYGQGIALSPIAMTRALAILANGGKLVTPRLVSEIDYANGEKKILEHARPVQVLRPESVEGVTRMLVKVVDEALRGGSLKMEHYSVAAKTGTAQIPDPSVRGYYKDRYLHSFFGYFPAYDPKFIIFLYQKYPKGAQFASETLVEPFSELSKFLIDYYSIPPDR